jgi:hypothetical protein
MITLLVKFISFILASYLVGSSSCVNINKAWFCYESAHRDKEFEHYYQAFDKLENQFLNFSRNSSIEYFKVTVSCQISAQYGFKLSYPSPSLNIPIIVFQPLLCVGAGNMMGFIFELISFGLAHNIAVGRISEHAKWFENQCSSRVNMASMFRYLPKFVIPENALQNQQLDEKYCKQVAEWPWESNNPRYFKYLNSLAKINHLMVTNYLRQESQNNHSGGFHSVSLVATHEQWKTFSKSFMIHFRCSDNLAHQYMGLLPYSDYNQTLQQIVNHPLFTSSIRSIIIHTDAALYISHGEMCVRALAEFEYLIQSHPKLSQYDRMVYRTTTAYTYAMLHLSKYLFCSASTLCFFAAFGNEHAYIPYGKHVVITLPIYQITSNFTFIKTRMIRPSSPTMAADQFARLFLST